MTHGTEISVLHPDLPENVKRNKHTPSISISDKLENSTFFSVIIVPTLRSADKLTISHKNECKWKQAVCQMLMNGIPRTQASFYEILTETEE